MNALSASYDEVWTMADLQRQIAILTMRVRRLEYQAGQRDEEGLLTVSGKRAKMMRMVEKVSADVGISVRDIMSRRKVNHIALARHMAVYALHTAKYRDAEIAALFKFDRTTAIYARTRIAAMFERGELDQPKETNEVCQ